MRKASFQKYILHFKEPSGTSRGLLRSKETWFLKIEDGQHVGIGECGMFRGLSCDDRPDFETKLQWLCDHIHLDVETLYSELTEFPSLQTGLEMAFKSLTSEDPFILFPSEFTQGKESIPINGLVWMGDQRFMKEQILQKLKEGFRCIKMKIGAIDFPSELELLKFIRREFPASDVELRVDANGAFAPSEALEKLKRLSDYDLHSIEQPIKQGQWDKMARLCAETPLDIALDEELIGIFSEEKKLELLKTVQPQYIILKPSLIGGFSGTDQWIQTAEDHKIGWWMTSALESNIGLNAIAQFTFKQQNEMLQGLGTGELFTNNISSPLHMRRDQVHYDPIGKWSTKLF